MFTLHEGRRYRLKVRNASDDIHPLHLHRHSFELTRIGGKPAAGVIKDVVMLGGFQELECDFVATIRDRLFSTAPAIAHGFRIHGALQLCVSSRDSIGQEVAILKLIWLSNGRPKALVLRHVGCKRPAQLICKTNDRDALGVLSQ